MKINTRDEIIEFARKHGKAQTAELLRIMSGKVELYKAMMTYPGTALLADIRNDWLTLFHKVVDISATEEEKLEFKVVNRILTKWATRISDVMDFDSSEYGGTS